MVEEDREREGGEEDWVSASFDTFEFLKECMLGVGFSSVKYEANVKNLQAIGRQ